MPLFPRDSYSELTEFFFFFWSGTSCSTIKMWEIRLWCLVCSLVLKYPWRWRCKPPGLCCCCNSGWFKSKENRPEGPSSACKMTRSVQCIYMKQTTPRNIRSALDICFQRFLICSLEHKSVYSASAEAGKLLRVSCTPIEYAGGCKPEVSGVFTRAMRFPLNF